MENHSEHNHEHGHEHHTHETHGGHHTAANNDLAFPKFDFGHMDFGSAFKKVVEIAKLNKTAMSEVANDEKLNSVALVFWLVSFLAAPLGMLIFGISFFGVTVHASFTDVAVEFLRNLLMAAAGLYAVTLVANRLFKGAGSFAQMFRLMGFVSLINVLLLIGYLLQGLLMIIGLVVAIWTAIVGFNALQVAFNLDAKNAAFTLIVTFVVMMVVSSIVSGFGGAGSYGRGGNVSINY